MICRIQNLSRHRLALDLRGGGVIYVEPNESSPPLREELLYDNVHLKQWIAEGVARKVDSHVGELKEHHAEVEKQAKAAAAAAQEADAKASAGAAGKGRRAAKAAEEDEEEEHRPERKHRKGKD